MKPKHAKPRAVCAALLPAAALLLLAAPARRDPPRAQDGDGETFTVGGAVEKPGDWTAERLEKELGGEVRPVEYDAKPERGRARCVPLLALVRAAKPKLDPKRKNHLLAFAASVRSEDGYVVTFSLGELTPDQGGRDVWVALDRAAAPLPKAERPVRLIVPGDKRPARWAYGVRSVTLIDTSAEPEGPARAPKPDTPKPDTP